jgi:hypothetical protein
VPARPARVLCHLRLQKSRTNQGECESGGIVGGVAPKKERSVNMARTVQDELKRRISYMQGIGFDDAPARLTGFLEWLESEPATFKILNRLRSETDIETLLKSAGPHQPPKLATPEDVVRIGLYFFEFCKEHATSHNQLPGLLFGIGCQATYGNFNNHFNLALEKYINPFLKFLQEELHNTPQRLSVDDTIEVRRELILGDEFETKFPNTSRLLKNLSKEMAVFAKSENWFNIANSCRETLKQFSSELLSVPQSTIHIEGRL